jgi:peroxiredoxin
MAACHGGAATSSPPPPVSAAVGAGPSTQPAASVAANAPGTAQLGQPAPDFALPDLDGRTVRLGDLRGRVVVLEWFNPDCPFVKLNHTKGPLKDMAKRWSSRGVTWLSINSGAPGKQGNGIDSSRAGKTRYGMENAIVLDERGTAGHAYGAKHTPTMYVIDARGVLVYMGGIDNAPDGDPPGGQRFVNYVEGALADVIAGRPVATQEAPAYGCSVKYAD